MNIAILAAITAPLILIFDLLWLGLIMPGFYRANLGHLMSSSIGWGAAIVFYALYAVGLAYFVIQPAVGSLSLMRALLVGAFFGLIAYGTYDLSNQATLRDWPLIVTVVDMLWGMFLSGAASAIAYLLATKVFGL